MTTNATAVTAAAEAICGNEHGYISAPCSDCVEAATVVVAAVRPIIAAETAQLRAKLDAIHRLCEPYHTEETTFVRADDILVIIDGGTS